MRFTIVLRTLPLAAAFVILALYTYSAGLRAPALIAFVKDLMIYIVVLVAVVLVPMKLGGYGHVFEVAGAAYSAKGGAENNTAAEYIANPLGSDPGNYFLLTASPKGSFTIYNSGTKQTKDAGSAACSARHTG